MKAIGLIIVLFSFAVLIYFLAVLCAIFSRSLHSSIDCHLHLPLSIASSSSPPPPLPLSPQTQEVVRVEQQSVRDIICGLLEHIGRGLDETSQMPSQDALGERYHVYSVLF
jgi:hypothetical protein